MEKNTVIKGKKISKAKVKSPNPNDMSKEELQAALIKKKECDAIALKIVERLMENPVPPEMFLYSLRYVNPSHLEDVIEERSIIKQCGYPICLGTITTVPRKQYSISTKSNKVYDITERKKFCSNQCYKASIFIKEQMLTSPLWLRDKEEIPDFKLLPWTTKGAPGLEVDFGLSNIEIEPQFTSAAEFVEQSLEDAPDSFEELEHNSYLESEAIAESTEETKPSCSKSLKTKTTKSSTSKQHTNGKTNEEIKPTCSKSLKTKTTKSGTSKERINRKTIENKLSEAIAEDDYFKHSKHDLKLINLSAQNRKEESEKLSVQSVRERLENRRRAMEKRQMEKATQNVQNLNDSFSTKNNKNEIKNITVLKNQFILEPNLNVSTENNKNDIKNVVILKDGPILQLSESYQNLNLNESKIKSSSDQLEGKFGNNVQSLLSQDNSKHAENLTKTLDETNEMTQNWRNVLPRTENLIGNLIQSSNLLDSDDDSDEDVEVIKAKSTVADFHKSNVQENITDSKFNSQESENKPTEYLKKPIGQNLTTTELAIQHIESCVSEWFTIDSLIFLHGEQKVRQEISSQSNQIQEKLNRAIENSKDIYKSETYLQLCRKIDLLEMEENRQDNLVMNQQLKPLPDYRILRRENKRLIVKVRSFYRGIMEFEEPNYSDSETEDESEDEPDQKPIILPTVDKNAQNVLRRKIVYNYLNKALPGLLQTFGLTSHDMGNEIRSLIGTFHLTAKNIIFKPIHLNLLAVIVLKLLAVKNGGLFKLMEESTAIKYTNILLGIYKLPEDWSDHFIRKITKLENIIDKHCNNVNS